MSQKVLYWCDRINSGYWQELKKDLEFQTLTVNIAYDYKKGGMARFYRPVKNILNLENIDQVLDLFKDCKDRQREIDVTIKQAFELIELFEQHGELGHLHFRGISKKDASEDAAHAKYIQERDAKIEAANKWYKSISKEEKEHVDVLIGCTIPTAG